MMTTLLLTLARLSILTSVSGGTGFQTQPVMFSDGTFLVA